MSLLSKLFHFINISLLYIPQLLYKMFLSLLLKYEQGELFEVTGRPCLTSPPPYPLRV